MKQDKDTEIDEKGEELHPLYMSEEQIKETKRKKY